MYINVISSYSRRPEVYASAKIEASLIGQLCRNHQNNKQTFLFNIIIFNIMSSNNCEISYAFKCVVITCHSIYKIGFVDIERQIEMKNRIAVVIYQKAVERVDNKNFNDLLTHCNNNSRFEKSIRVFNNSVKSAKMREIMLKHSNLQLYTAVMNQENIKISNQKRFFRSFIERVQHKHQHTSQHTSFKSEKINELIRDKIIKKFRINVDEISKKKDFL